MCLHREAEAGVNPRGALQTVHPGVTGQSASRPAQEPRRFQVTRWFDTKVFLSEVRCEKVMSLYVALWVMLFVCFMFLRVQTEAQHGSDSGWRRTVEAGLGARKGGLGEGMLLRWTHPLQDRRRPVSPWAHTDTMTCVCSVPVLLVWLRANPELLCCRLTLQPAEEEKWWGSVMSVWVSVLVWSNLY